MRPRCSRAKARKRSRVLSSGARGSSSAYCGSAAISSAVMFALIFGVARGESFWSTVVVVVTVGMTIKLGYFVGIFLAKRIQ